MYVLKRWGVTHRWYGVQLCTSHNLSEMTTIQKKQQLRNLKQYNLHHCPFFINFYFSSFFLKNFIFLLFFTNFSLFFIFQHFYYIFTTFYVLDRSASFRDHYQPSHMIFCPGQTGSILNLRNQHKLEPTAESV